MSTSRRNNSKTKGHQHDQNFYVVALDLDSILYASKRNKIDCSKRDITFLRGLQERGVTVALVTNRSMMDIKEFILKLKPKEPLPLVICGGATGVLCHVPQSSQKIVGQLVCQERISRRIAQVAIDAACIQGCMTLYHVEDSIYANPKSTVHIKYATVFQKSFNKELVFVGDYFEALLQQPGSLPNKLQILSVQSIDKLSKFKGLEEMKADLTQGFDGRLGGQYVEVQNPKATKSRALVNVFRDLGLHPKSCIAGGFQDGDDVDTLLAAGCRVTTKPFLDQEVGKRSCITVPSIGGGGSVLSSNTSQDPMKDLRKMDREGILQSWSQ